MLILLSVVTRSPTQPAPFDWAGQVLAVIALSTLVCGLIEGGHVGFGSLPAVGALTVAVLTLVGFVVVQARVRHPMMPLDLLRARGFRLTLPVGFAFMSKLRQRVRGQPLPAAGAGAVTAARRSRVRARAVLRNRCQPGLRADHQPLRCPTSRRGRPDGDGDRPHGYAAHRSAGPPGPDRCLCHPGRRWWRTGHAVGDRRGPRGCVRPAGRNSVCGVQYLPAGRRSDRRLRRAHPTRTKSSPGCASASASPPPSSSSPPSAASASNPAATPAT